MGKLIQPDISEIAVDVAKQSVTHVTSFPVSTGAKVHGYVIGDAPDILAGTTDDIMHADIIIIIDGSGAYDVFMTDGLRGVDLLFETAIKKGLVSEYAPTPNVSPSP